MIPSGSNTRKKECEKLEEYRELTEEPEKKWKVKAAFQSRKVGLRE